MSNDSAIGFAVRTNDEAFDLLLDEIGQRLRQGEMIDVDACTERYPEYAERLRRVLPGMQALASLGHVESVPDGYPPQSGTGSETQALGDYQIIREIGRGGMGVVYEAEQLSLGRHVALKVLPFAAVLDERQLKRFKNEALAAAQLDHPHIVDVYGVGCERSVHFYAMRYVEGHSLAEVIAHLQFAAEETPAGDSGSGHRDAGALADTARLAALSTERAADTHEFFRSAARIGVEVAEALDHAHQQGVVHRDVKPANIMLDAAGKAWVTDFGLAHLETGVTLTMTGDLVGTLRYMSPEQALAKRVVVDHRTDVYSLGVTLYELLTLQPAFPDENRQELLRKIAFEEPTPPTRINRSIPSELETIVLKAISKNPSERYETAQELADDLQRFLKDEPIRARPPGSLRRFAKWSRRHRPFVWSAAVCVTVVFAAVAGSVGWIVRDRGAQQAALEVEVLQALEESRESQERGDWPQSLAAAGHAESLLAGSDAGGDLRGRVLNRIADLKTVDELERIRLARGSTAPEVEFEGLAPPGDLFSDERTDAAYAAAFREIGIDLDSLSVQGAAVIVRARSVGVELASALDHWALVRRELGDVSGSRHLLGVARAADDDAWRNGLRDIAMQPERDARTLSDLAASAPIEELPPATVVRLAELLDAEDQTGTAVTVLRRAQRAYPDDLWVNVWLGRCYYTLGEYEDSIRFFTAAIALRPRNPDLLVRLGRTFTTKGGAGDEAVAACREAIRLQPDLASAHTFLAWALIGKKDPHHFPGTMRREIPELQEAERELREAMRLDGEYYWTYHALGYLLSAQNRFDEAEPVLREAIRLNPESNWAHYRLGYVLAHGQRRWEESIPVLETAASLDSEYYWSFELLGQSCRRTGRWSDAHDAYLRALELAFSKAQRANAHFRLGQICEIQGDEHDALDHFNAASAIRADHGGTDTSLMTAQVAELALAGRWHDAMELLQQVIALRPGNHYVACRAAPLMVEVGDLEGYRRTCDDLLDKRTQPNQISDRERIVKYSLLVPGALDDRRDEILTLADSIVGHEKSDAWCYLVRGLAAYRFENPADALPWLQKSLETEISADHHPYARANTLLLMAMVQHRTGQSDEAQETYDRATDFIDREIPKLGSPDLIARWHDWLTCDILRREAEETLGLQLDNDLTTNEEQR